MKTLWSGPSLPAFRMAMALAMAVMMLGAQTPAVRAEDTIVLDGSAFELEAPTVEPAAPQSTPFVSLQRGSAGEGVKQVQNRLTELGFYHGKISGDFLDGTDSATRSFQKANGLAVNGKITATTWNAMMHPNAIGKDGLTHPPLSWQPIAEDPAAPAATPAPPTVQDDPSITPLPASGFVYRRKMERGSEGGDVASLQQRLADLGYFTLKISGNYLSNTRDAVKEFQRINGLVADGVAGEATQRLLWDDALALPAGSPARPAPTPKPLQYMLKVDVTNQVTSAYELDANGEYTVLVRQMICSTGTKSNPTPLKTTQSKGSRARWGYFPEWDSHAQYLSRIDSKNAFHSVLYSQPDPMQLVVSAYKALGSRASHGCVRLLVEDAKWIYDNCPSGTTITVYEGESDPELTQMLKPPPLDRSRMLPESTPAPTAPPVWDPNTLPTPYRILSKGVTGADVWWLQTKLTYLGLYRGTISGGYYGGTIAAVKAFQKLAGIKADGVAGPVTLKALYENPAYATPDVQPGTPQDSTQWIQLPTALPATTSAPRNDGGNSAPAPTIAPPADGTVWLTPPPPPDSIGGGIG